MAGLRHNNGTWLRSWEEWVRTVQDTGVLQTTDVCSRSYRIGHFGILSLWLRIHRPTFLLVYLAVHQLLRSAGRGSVLFSPQLRVGPSVPFLPRSLLRSELPGHQTAVLRATPGANQGPSPIARQPIEPRTCTNAPNAFADCRNNHDEEKLGEEIEHI